MTRFVIAALAAALFAPAVHAGETSAGWQACTAIAEPGARLACFDRWSAQQSPLPPAPAAPAAAANPPATVAARDDSSRGHCHHGDGTKLARFWELDRDTSCDVFGIRGYRPISLSLIGSDSVNVQPTSDNPLNNAAASQPYRRTETRIQLSVRTKIAQGLLTRGDARDSLWFAYTQQSYWQVFTPALSRPFRSTDHEPEFIYVHPLALAPLAGWSVRYAGVGLVHQSNGQSLPLSRSWNRVYLMAGAEHGPFTLQARVWQRIPEAAADDDNPHIADWVGRAEVTGTWEKRDDTLALTWRNTLHGLDRGSVRLEYLRRIASRTPSPLGTLRFHVQVFSGYGDSLLDYNRRRTVLGVGLSLVDW